MLPEDTLVFVVMGTHLRWTMKYVFAAFLGTVANSKIFAYIAIIEQLFNGKCKILFFSSQTSTYLFVLVTNE